MKNDLVAAVRSRVADQQRTLERVADALEKAPPMLLAALAILVDRQTEALWKLAKRLPSAEAEEE